MMRRTRGRSQVDDATQTRGSQHPPIRWYKVPKLVDSHEEYERCYHQDLPRLADSELWVECRRVEFALVYYAEEIDKEWLAQRLRRVIEEMRSRRQPQTSRNPTPSSPVGGDTFEDAVMAALLRDS